MTKLLLAYRVVLDGSIWQILVCWNAAHLQSSPPNFLPTKHSCYTVASYVCVFCSMSDYAGSNIKACNNKLYNIVTYTRSCILATDLLVMSLWIHQWLITITVLWCSNTVLWQPCNAFELQWWKNMHFFGFLNADIRLCVKSSQRCLSSLKLLTM